MATESYLLRDAVGVRPDETMQRLVTGGPVRATQKTVTAGGGPAIWRWHVCGSAGSWDLNACESALGTVSRSGDGLVNLVAATPC
jgi:hypothetical protein